MPSSRPQFICSHNAPTPKGLQSFISARAYQNRQCHVVCSSTIFSGNNGSCAVRFCHPHLSPPPRRKKGVKVSIPFSGQMGKIMRWTSFSEWVRGTEGAGDILSLSNSSIHWHSIPVPSLPDPPIFLVPHPTPPQVIAEKRVGSSHGDNLLLLLLPTYTPKEMPSLVCSTYNKGLPILIARDLSNNTAILDIAIQSTSIVELQLCTYSWLTWFFV